jgi:hypothetical protein
MSKTISVKVSTKKVITALEKALNERKKQKEQNEKEWKDYEQAEKDFRDTLAEAFRSGKGKVVSVSKGYVGFREQDNNRYDLGIEFPASIKAPKEPKGHRSDYSLNAQIEELENAIAVLKLTDEETVSTNTYKGVAQYIK